MPRISEINVCHRATQPTLAVHGNVATQDLPQFIADGYARLSKRLEELVEMTSDIPYTAYFNADPENFEIELGFPVREALEGAGDVKSGQIPSGLYVSCLYRGSYDDMAETYDEMHEWIEENGYVTDGTSYEFFYNGPPYPIEEMITMVMLPVQYA